MDDLQERKARAVDAGLQQARYIKDKRNPWTRLEYVLGVHYNGTDKHENQIEEYDREESFECRRKKARAILLTSK